MPNLPPHGPDNPPIRNGSGLRPTTFVRMARNLSAEATHSVRIVQTYDSNGVIFDDWQRSYLATDGAHDIGSGSEIRYNIARVSAYDGSEAWMRRPPLVGLYHEMVHSLNCATVTMQPGDGTGNKELQAVGLPITFEAIPFRWDSNPATPLSTDNPTQFTENGLRAFLGIALRTHY